MEEMAKDDPVNYTYGTDVVIHLKKVAHTAVRYTGTMAGNLMALGLELRAVWSTAQAQLQCLWPRDIRHR